MLTGLRILVAEDDPTNRLVASQMLESLGATTLLATDGAEALAAVAAETVDVLLVDIEMPNVSGLEVIRRVVAEADPARPALVALTAYATRTERDEITAAGADGVITKPIVSIEQLGADIRACVERRRTLAGRTDPVEAEIDRDIYDGLAAAVGPGAMKELLGKVDADLCDALDRLTRAVEDRDMSEVRAATHILIAVAGAMGAVGLQGLSERLNRAAHQRDHETIDAMGFAIAAEAERVRRFIQRGRMG